MRAGDMQIEMIINMVLDDLALVAQYQPNERLPKEEQIRCSMYAAVRPMYEIVCAERGYGSIDKGSRMEADLWAFTTGTVPVWIEFKRCWSIAGWNNKPPEQVRDWEADIAKLRSLPIQSDRYFVLVGLFDGDPLPANQSNRKLASLIDTFYSPNLIHSAVRDFRWRQDDGITHLAAWVWFWQKGQQVQESRSAP
jgi:hypothetical protein